MGVKAPGTPNKITLSLFKILPVVISFSGKDADADIKLPNNISILLNDKSYRDLEEICGNENVDLVYHPLPYLH